MVSSKKMSFIMSLYENVKVKVRPPDGDTDIVADVFPGNTLAPYEFIICIDYVLQTSTYLMKENGFTLKKAKSRRYSEETIMDAVYADDKCTYPRQTPAA